MITKGEIQGIMRAVAAEMKVRETLLLEKTGAFVDEKVKSRAAALEIKCRRLEAENQSIRERLEKMEKKAGHAGSVKLILP